MNALCTIPSLLLSLVAAACGGASTAMPTTNTAATRTQGSSDIVDTAVAAGSFQLFAAALKAADSLLNPESQSKLQRILSAARGQAAVVYSYPKGETPDCTEEVCAFRGVLKRYAVRHFAIFGVPRDSQESCEKFRANHALPCPLVSDEDATIADAHGVSSTLGMTSRVTLLVGTDGTIVRAWPDVDPGVHGDVLAAAEAALAGPKALP